MPKKRKTQLEETYSHDYCAMLELTYDEGMLSEGSIEAIEAMFEGISLKDKTMLDIGFGLGGACFYLAQQYHANVTGIELNEWMVKEAQSRCPDCIRDLVDFVSYEEGALLPFSSEQFDCVFSKGVLTHVEDKLPLFLEIYRVLKAGGHIVIDDWLSPIHLKWGNTISRLIELESLPLYAHSESYYTDCLERSGFKGITIVDRSQQYLEYNKRIVNKCSSPSFFEKFVKQYDEAELISLVQGYEIIVAALESQELLIRGFTAKKVE